MCADNDFNTKMFDKVTAKLKWHAVILPHSVVMAALTPEHIQTHNTIG